MSTLPAPQKRRFVSIVGLSDERRIPRLGRIRLGHVNYNTQSEKTNPEEDPFFHVPEEVERVYGTKTPTELDIMFPVNDRGVVFAQAYEYYGGGKRLLCSGDGRQAMRWDAKKLTMQPTECPCNLLGDGCKQRAHLLVMLPKVRQTGVYQIDTSSVMSIININSYLHMLAPDDNPDSGLLGYFAMVPMKLRRVPRDIFPKGYHRKSYPLELVLEATEDEIRDLRARKDEVLAQTRKWVVQLPEQQNPEQDAGAIVTIDEKDPGTVATELPGGPLQNNGTAGIAPDPPSVQPVTAQEPTPSAPTPSDPATPTTPPLASPAEASHGAPPDATAAKAPACVTPLRTDRMTPAQRSRILSKTRKVSIPDQAVDDVTASFTKKQASDLINQVDAGNFSAFDRREQRDVPLPAAS
jgi:hypothetical protein